MVDWKAHMEGKDRISLIVRPNSPKTEIVSFDTDMDCYRVRVKAAPEKGEANIEIVKFFTKLLKADVKVVLGLTSKRKVLKIS